MPIKSKIQTLLYLTISLIFFLQAYANAEIIPSKLIRSVFSPLEFTPSTAVIVLLFLYGIFSTAITIYLSMYAKKFPDKKEWAKQLIIAKNSNETIAFLNIWVTFVFFIVMAVLRLMPMEINLYQLTDIYIFWFFIFKAVRLDDIIKRKMQTNRRA